MGAVFCSSGNLICPGNNHDDIEPTRTVGHVGQTKATAQHGGHIRPVFSIVFFANNSRAITCSGDGTLKIWDTTEFCVKDTLIGGHSGKAIFSCCVFDEGAFAASGGDDGSVCIWDLVTRKIARPPLQGHMGCVLSVCAGTIQGRPVIYSGGFDSEIILWNPHENSAPAKFLTRHDGAVHCLCLFDDGKQLLSGSADSTAKVPLPLRLLDASDKDVFTLKLRCGILRRVRSWQH